MMVDCLFLNHYKFNEKELLHLKDLELQELAKKIIIHLLDDFMRENDLSKIIDKSYSFLEKKML